MFTNKKVFCRVCKDELAPDDIQYVLPMDSNMYVVSIDNICHKCKALKLENYKNNRYGKKNHSNCSNGSAE